MRNPFKVSVNQARHHVLTDTSFNSIPQLRATQFQTRPPRLFAGGVSQKQRNRDRMGCKRLVLSHLGREVLARLEDVSIETAHDGMVVDV